MSWANVTPFIVGGWGNMPAMGSCQTVRELSNVAVRLGKVKADWLPKRKFFAFPPIPFIIWDPTLGYV